MRAHGGGNRCRTAASAGWQSPRQAARYGLAQRADSVVKTCVPVRPVCRGRSTTGGTPVGRMWGCDGTGGDREMHLRHGADLRP